MSRLLRGFAALVAPLSLLIGVPIGLVGFVGRPWPTPFPAASTVWASVRRGDISDGAAIKLLAVVLWLAWGRLVLSVVIELAAALAGKSPPRLGALGSSQQSAAAIVAALLMLFGLVPRGVSASSSSATHPRSVPLTQVVSRLLPAVVTPEPAPATCEVKSPRRAPAPIGLGGAVMIAAGVVAAITLRRRRHLRAAVGEVRVPVPIQHLVVAETIVRRLDEGDRLARLDIVLRALSSQIADVVSGVGVLAVLQSTDGALEMVLSGPTPTPPLPWLAVLPDRWRLPACVGLDELAPFARTSHQPCPALVHVGRSTDITTGEAAQVFVDLEAAALLVIEADQPHAANVARAIAASVSVSPLSEMVQLITCGLNEAHLGRPASQTARCLDEAIDAAVGHIGAIAAMTNASVSTFALRSQSGSAEAWEPTIVVAANSGQSSEATADLDHELVRLTAIGGRGLAIVVDRPVAGARWRLQQRTHDWVLQPLGLAIVPVGLTADEIGCIRELLDASDTALLPAELTVVTPPTEGATIGDPGWVEPPWSLMVRILGPVEVCDRMGVVASFERSKALELVVWLSQHRDRSTRTAARTALWEIDVRDATFANVVSDARRALARLSANVDGDEWIPRTLTEQLPMHNNVVTDADFLRMRFELARTQCATDAIDMLRPGLELVRDQAFFGTGYLWTDAEGVTSQLTVLVTSAASVLAGHYLTLGDVDGVFWATGQGLKVLPGHEELIALRMRAHAARGDLAGVRQEWQSYERALSGDSFSSGDPAPKLAALRRDLLSSSLLVV